MKIKPPILNSERLILRPFKLSDVKDLLEIKSKRIKNIKEAKQWIKKSIDENGFYLAVVLKEENKVIGYRELCHLNWWDFKAGEICAHFNKNYWNKGYSTESGKILINYCFKKLKFHKVYADTDPNNLASQRVLEKLGFKLEGRIRDRRIVKGQWIDEMDYGLLKSEWRGK